MERISIQRQFYETLFGETLRSLLPSAQAAPETGPFLPLPLAQRLSSEHSHSTRSFPRRAAASGLASTARKAPSR